MKRKFSKILGVGLTLALLASLLLTASPVMALSVPSVTLSDYTISKTGVDYTLSFNLGKELGTVATLETSGTGAAEWVTDAPSGYTGTSVAKLTCPAPVDLLNWSAAKVAYGETLATLVTHTKAAGSYTVLDVAFTVWATDDWVPYAMLWIDEDADGTVDTRLTGGFEVQADGTVGTPLTAWTEMYKVSVATWQLRDYDAGVVTDYTGTNASDVDSLPGYLADGGANAIVEYVGVGYCNNDDPAYVDDILINGDPVGGGTITITFPTGTVVHDGTITGATIQASPGWIGGQWENARTEAVTFAGVAATRMVTATLGASDVIGEGATVRIQVPGIGNPDGVADDYTLTVATSQEAAVTSDTFALIAPVIPGLPGVVTGKNSAGIILYQKTGDLAINNAIGWTGVVTVEVGPGTYIENLVCNDAAVLTIKSTDGAAVTTISGTVTITQPVTFDGFTVTGTLTADSDTVTAPTVKNCILQGAIGAVVTQAVTLTDNTYEVGADEVGISVVAGTATVSGSIFDIAATGTGILNAGTLKLSDATLTGASGVGINTTAGTATITGTTFSGLDMALDIDGGSVDIRTSTITGCGNATTPSAAIDVLTATSVIIFDNTIADCVDKILNVVAGQDKVFMNFNTITNPAKGITADAASVDATNNLWDGGVAPPVTSTNATTSPYLIAAVSTPAISVGSATLVAKTTAGVNVTATGPADFDNPAAIAAATYADNPGTAAVPGVASAYFDVYVNSTGSDADTYTISLYGTVSANTKAYVWGAGLGQWVECKPQSVNVFAGSVSIVVTATSTPSISDLVGLPLAIADPAPTTVLATAPEIVMPKAGAVDVVLRPTFDWLPVAGADGYYFQLADNPLFAPPLLISFEGDVGRLLAVQTAYTYVPGLDDYATAYHWRVKAVSGTIGAGDLLESAWVENVFITMDEPVEPVEPVEPADVILEPADVIVTIPPATPITPSWIYVIIAVGAVLVIALLVLIVRTRRVA